MNICGGAFSKVFSERGSLELNPCNFPFRFCLTGCFFGQGYRTQCNVQALVKSCNWLSALLKSVTRQPM